MQIYVAKNGRQEGPYTTEQINSDVADFRIKPDDLAWIQGWSTWQPVSNLPGFVAVRPVAGMPAPPPTAGTTASAAPPPPPPPAPGSSSDRGALLRAFVGNNYEYYARKWAEAEQKPNHNSWNWPAFFFNALWLAYRKMYRYAWIIVGVLAAEVIGERLFGLSPFIVLGVNIAIGATCALRGNWWYWQFAEDKIRQAAPTGFTDEAERLRVAALGGTSLGALVGFAVLVAAVQLFSGGIGPNPKARTLETWNAFHKIDQDNLGALQNMNDPSNAPAAIRAFRTVALSYPQLNVSGVDQLLIDHLHHRTTSCSRAADVLESQYTDIVDVMKAREAGVNLSRNIGGAIADDDYRAIARDFAGWIYKLGTDSEFEERLQQVVARHKPQINAMSQELSKIEEEEKTVANTLSQKYAIQFPTED